MRDDPPTPAELEGFEERVNRHTLVHEDFRTFMGTFPRNAHPMAVLSSAILGETPHAYHAAAFALIVGGIVISARR